jgi:hypothetical protein
MPILLKTYRIVLCSRGPSHVSPVQVEIDPPPQSLFRPEPIHRYTPPTTGLAKLAWKVCLSWTEQTLRLHCETWSTSSHA